MSGLPAAPTPSAPAILGTAMAENDKREDYVRATLCADGRVVTPFPKQDSSMLKTLARADALVIRAPFAAPIAAGAEVEVIRLAPLGI